MTDLFKPSDLVRVTTEGIKPPNCDITLQFQPTFAEDGIARGTWEVDEKYINGIGVAMGGYLTAVADSMMAFAIASKLSDDQGFASIDLHTTFHRPVFVGKVEVEARVERLGRKVAYVVADLFQNDKKVGSSVSSVMITSVEK
ncbi:PaaI family thioesterase [Bacillus sp. FJAT-45350]|uniref:PaaI family thioesterase n=1 Tax=Bacillus sp. FJAT-45350 TaxID=2011014 RepID=UPI000BB882DD|nr:PaaI family thioesterase [Bacillus sp. FJAT-45350]